MPDFALPDGPSLRESFGLDDMVLADVRAVGDCVGPRVPDLIEDFYAWLSGLPEFESFFVSEALLAHVKSRQVDYWRDFLRADVDDRYVARRRVVGDTHARIELGLLIYLQAMEFVSAWLRNAIAAEPRLAERPNAVYSVRKLIKFDSAVVVDTYAARTALRLEQQRARLEQVAAVMRAVTDGDLDHQIDVLGTDDVLGTSLNEMVRSLRNIAREMGMIAQGDYSVHFTPRSGKDQLGLALVAMTNALRATAQKNEQLIWMANTQSRLGDAMSGNPSVTELAQLVVSQLCSALDAHVGAQYVADHGNGTLRLAGSFAAGDDLRREWKVGEGLVGQAALEKRAILVEDSSDGVPRIRFGLGDAMPRHVAVVPVLHENEVRGVLELATLGRFSEQHIQLLERVAPGIGLALTAAESRARIQHLLAESQAQSEELASQQEELRLVNDTLADQARTLELQTENLRTTETMLRHQAAELEAASRYKSEFLANMSHELRTPLNSSLILAKLLMENREGTLTPTQARYAESIYSAGNDLLVLINDILDLAKIEAGRIELDVEETEIARLLATLESRFRPLAAEKNLDFSIVAEDDCPENFATDAQRLQQILTNLLSNAIKFTDAGRVRLSAGSAGHGHIAFVVEDSGIGIAPEHQEVIFDAFHQADGTISRKFGGTGLGLSISRELCALLGGEISLESTPGEGSIFTVVLPLRQGAPSPAAARRRGAEPAAPHFHRSALPRPARREARAVAVPRAAQVAKRSPKLLIEDDRHRSSPPHRVVLVVEDDPAFAEILRDLARELGFHCIVAGAANDALDLAREHGPVAVVLDIGLPDHSGLTVLELLKRDPAVRHVPIHVISMHDYEQVAREMGAVGYILKPVKREQLVAAFQELEARLSRKVRSLLVVEDDRVQREAVMDLLSADHVEITAVPTGEEALVALRNDTFDCAVLDLMLPDISGLDLLERMSRDESCSFPPVIVYTARRLEEAEERRLRRLSKSIIVKGARSPERLLEEVTLFLHQVESELPADKQRMLNAARSREAVFEGRRILLAEDDVRNVFALVSVLEPKGAVVDIARNGKEALELLTAAPDINLVLMDVMMPEMSGLEATRAIRSHERWAELPIIALTAKTMPDDRMQCLEAGASDYIAKPVDPEKLLSLIRVWLHR